MGFLDRILSATEANAFSPWKELEDEAQLPQIIADSDDKPVVIFKHSIRCGTSSMVKHQLESNWDLTEDEIDFYYLDLINHRNISNRVADQFGVRHQSPQIIVLKNGKVVFDTSHHMISLDKIKEAIK